MVGYSNLVSEVEASQHILNSGRVALYQLHTPQVLHSIGVELGRLGVVAIGADVVLTIALVAIKEHGIARIEHTTAIVNEVNAIDHGVGRSLQLFDRRFDAVAEVVNLLVSECEFVGIECGVSLSVSCVGSFYEFGRTSTRIGTCKISYCRIGVVGKVCVHVRLELLLTLGLVYSMNLPSIGIFINCVEGLVVVTKELDRTISRGLLCSEHKAGLAQVLSLTLSGLRTGICAILNSQRHSELHGLSLVCSHSDTVTTERIVRSIILRGLFVIGRLQGVILNIKTG